VLFSVIALRWHDADTWQNLQHIWRLPAGVLIGEFVMVAQIAGTIGIFHPRTASAASAVLCIVYLCFSLACVPDIVAAANLYDKFGGSFFVFFCPFCAAMALYSGTGASATSARLFSRSTRIGVGLCAISFTLSQAILLHDTAELVPKWIPPNQIFWAFLTTVAFAFAAIAILVNFRAHLAMRMMSLMLTLFGLLVWVPRLVADPKAHFNWSEIALTLLASGAVLVVGSVKL
jgi:hypothetical protein